MTKRSTGLTVALVCAAGIAIHAADEKKLGWADTTEFGFVLTSGNFSTNALGFRNVAKHDWQSATLTLRAEALRAQDEATTRFAILRPDRTVRVVEGRANGPSVASYSLNVQFDRNITERLYWFAGAGWARNDLTGVSERSLVTGGVGNIWHNTDDLQFKTFYGMTWTDERSVAGISDRFVGIRTGYDYLNELTATISMGSLLLLDINASETRDGRGDWTNWVAVAINRRLALKAELQLLYDNQPVLESMDLVTRSGLPGLPAFIGIGSFTRPVDKLDSIFTASLVINW
jgi:putative salt-induced outer membrane protein YdiY